MMPGSRSGAKKTVDVSYSATGRSAMVRNSTSCTTSGRKLTTILGGFLVGIISGLFFFLPILLELPDREKVSAHTVHGVSPNSRWGGKEATCSRPVLF